MRIFILFGFIILADSIGAQTGYEMSNKTVFIAAILFIAAIFMDVQDFLVD